MFSVLLWGCNWILFRHGWFCPICLIYLIGWISFHFENKNAFQYDAYCPLVARISQHALLQGLYLSRGVYLPGEGGVPAGGCTCQAGCTCQGVYLQWVYLSRRGTCPGTPPVNRMTDRCKNITLPKTSFAGGKNRLYAIVLREPRYIMIITQQVLDICKDMHDFSCDYLADYIRLSKSISF